MYFVLKVPQERVPVPLQETDPPLTANGNLGRCRRHAPTMSGFPAVFQGDWCGDHKLNENSL